MIPVFRHTLRLLALVLLVCCLVGGAWGWFELNTPYAGWEGHGITVDLARGLDAGSLLERLHEAGVLRSPRLSKFWLLLRGGSDSLQAGEYRFEEPLTPKDVLARLQAGEVLLHPVTLPEGLDLLEVAGRFSEAGFGEKADLLEAFQDAAPLGELDAEAADLEGYLFPDTYYLPRGETPERIARSMVERFREVIGPEYAKEAEARGLTLRQAVTIASMIEKETSRPEERWKISRVFHNRLERGMKLQCDPTVIYALRRAGKPVGVLRLKDLEFISPWNTYVVKGLPPGPICSPGRESLDAAIHPAEGADLYFVASPQGGHNFSRDLESHQDAVRIWRRSQRSSR